LLDRKSFFFFGTRSPSSLLRNLDLPELPVSPTPPKFQSCITSLNPLLSHPTHHRPLPGINIGRYEDCQDIFLIPPVFERDLPQLHSQPTPSLLLSLFSSVGWFSFLFPWATGAIALSLSRSKLRRIQVFLPNPPVEINVWPLPISLFFRCFPKQKVFSPLNWGQMDHHPSAMLPRPVLLDVSVLLPPRTSS